MTEVVLDLSILAICIAAALVMWYPRLRHLQTWRAMATPLASIIGSGFLVLGPLLDYAYGGYAPLVMALLCLVSYGFGSAIRYNIAVIADREKTRGKPEELIETVAGWTLGFAYIVSVAYYLNLFGSFGVALTTVDDSLHARTLTSAMLVVILIVGWRGGFKSLERMEYMTVSVKLSIIAGLLLGLLLHFGEVAVDGGLLFNEPQQTGWTAITLAFGLIVTVQGFETSRYLGETYDAATRIRSMRWAQGLSALIYVAYIALLAYVFERGQLELDETAIIDMMHVVAPILPVLLVGAALAAQFSAAVADAAGSGGLIEEQSGNRIPPRVGYVLLTAVGLTLTWTANVFEIIVFASRAFALYYAMQSAIATASAVRAGHARRAVFFAAMALLGLAIFIFGQTVEGAQHGG